MKKNSVIWIKTTGEVDTIEPKGNKMSLEELQTLVGGYIEIIDLGKAQFVVNEEGRLMNLPVNKVATVIARDYGYPVDFLVGNVVLAKRGSL